jgi:hypothetical protein
MRYDITEPEQKFSSVVSGLTTLVLSAFEQYESEKKQLVEACKKILSEKEELQSRLDKALGEKE